MDPVELAEQNPTRYLVSIDRGDCRVLPKGTLL
ncbi:MAG: hypothetical protein QOI92_1979, partial [Chloroflexota bacterium]|nr:hypothetical protein [Chloroflexota bacterium]